MNKEVYTCKNNIEVEIVSNWMYNLLKEKINKGLVNIIDDYNTLTVTVNEII